MIDNAEDRHKFSAILDSIGVDQPAWTEVTSVDAAKEFAARVGYVPLSRPPSAILKFAVILSLFDHRMSCPEPP